MNMRTTYLFFFGPPGSGKGTQVDMLAQKAGLPVISPGEMLRHEEQAGTPIGKMVGPLMDKGKMVPDSLVEKMIISRLKKKDAVKGAIFDGFPRDLEQLAFIAGVASKKKADCFAFYLGVPDKEVLKRLGGRRVCDCGASYHIEYNVPKKKGICNLCGKKLTIRPDDKPAIMKARLKQYHETINPILDYFKKEGKLKEFDGTQPISLIHGKILRFVKNLRLEKNFHHSSPYKGEVRRGSY